MKITIVAKSIIILLSCLILAGFAVFAVFFIGDFFSGKPEIGSPDCVFNIEEKIVRGDSLAPMIKDGRTVKVFFGFYDCNKIKREDLALYDYAGSQNPLIKIVKGIPGDRFALRETGGGWHILINDEALKNSEDIPYLISGKRYGILSLYEKDYKGLIPDNAYLLLGNLVSGATDSTRFGLVSKSGILAKAEVIDE